MPASRGQRSWKGCCELSSKPRVATGVREFRQQLGLRQSGGRSADAAEDYLHRPPDAAASRLCHEGADAADTSTHGPKIRVRDEEPLLCQILVR